MTTTDTKIATVPEAAATLREVRARLSRAEIAAGDALERLEQARAAAGLAPDDPEAQRELAAARKIAAKTEEALLVAAAGEEAAVASWNAAIAEAERVRLAEVQVRAFAHNQKGRQLTAAALDALNAAVAPVRAANLALADWAREASMLKNAGGAVARFEPLSAEVRRWDDFTTSTGALARELRAALERYEITWGAPATTADDQADQIEELPDVADD